MPVNSKAVRCCRAVLGSVLLYRYVWKISMNVLLNSDAWASISTIPVLTIESMSYRMEAALTQHSERMKVKMAVNCCSVVQCLRLVFKKSA